MDEDETDEAIASIAPLDGSFEAVGDTDLIEETVVSLNKDDDKLDENKNNEKTGFAKKQLKFSATSVLKLFKEDV
ncbi:Hypothetical predicted protein [Mytilus galloprovincialis]|uniref:Uncharacterized protein n=1 Tax=Mytilus galloprovincialis TaxID=29158 RepID=A0A8B6C8E8_MYTGA|nr:Hypothetical predicted protein [Mytilus galloprovincialis]